MGRKNPPALLFDRSLLLCALALLLLSVVLISSASVMEAGARFGDENHFLKRQLFYVAASGVVFLFVLMLPTTFLAKSGVWLLGVSFLLLLALLVFGREINGAKRWLEFGFFNVQPAEVFKLCWIIFLSGYVSRKGDRIRQKLWQAIRSMGLIAGIVAIVAVLLNYQHDTGSFAVTGGITLGILFVAGAPLLLYLGITGLLVAAGALVVWFSPYRLQRVISFLDPWADEFGTGYQLTQSLMAFGRGGLTGEGLGNSIQKLGYLPEAHTDFIAAIFGEEFGFIGMCVLIVLEFFIVFKAVRLGICILKQGPYFQGFLSFGIGVWFCMQTVINIGAAAGILPTKGLTLPFVSYGGSSLMVMTAGFAMLMRTDFEWRQHRFGPKNRPGM